MEYLAILTTAFTVSLFLEHKYHIHLYNSRKERSLIPIIFFIIGTAWDSFAVLRGHWSFGHQGLVGIKIGVLPIEEYLFFLIMSYFTLTLYKVLTKKI